jgi:hypothetical protein
MVKQNAIRRLSVPLSGRKSGKVEPCRPWLVNLISKRRLSLESVLHNLTKPVILLFYFGSRGEKRHTTTAASGRPLSFGYATILHLFAVAQGALSATHWQQVSPGSVDTATVSRFVGHSSSYHGIQRESGQPNFPFPYRLCVITEAGKGLADKTNFAKSNLRNLFCPLAR